jgi:hypothetical protein
MGTYMTFEPDQGIFAGLPLRGGNCPALPHKEMVVTQSLGMKLAKRIGMKKAKVAIARKIAVILH